MGSLKVALRSSAWRRRIGLALLILGVGLIGLSVGLMAFYGRKPAKEVPPKADINAWVPPSSSISSAIPISYKERLIIPKIGVDEEIYEGVDDATLDKGVGHFPETARPGENGNSVLTAHGASGPTHGAPFERLDELGEGDEIILYDRNGKVHKYIVSEYKIIAETDLSVLEPTEEPSVTLITCVVPSRVTHQRRVIVAVLKNH